MDPREGSSPEWAETQARIHRSRPGAPAGPPSGPARARPRARHGARPPAQQIQRSIRKHRPTILLSRCFTAFHMDFATFLHSVVRARALRPPLALVRHQIRRLDMDAQRRQSLEHQMTQRASLANGHGSQLNEDVVWNGNPELRLLRIWRLRSSHNVRVNCNAY